MTGGTTAHGLRYPGGDDPLYDVPAYLENLATDIDTKVAHSADTPGKVFAYVETHFDFNAIGAVFAEVRLPTIRWCRGAIVTQQKWSSGSVTRPALLSVSPEWDKHDEWDQNYWNLMYVLANDPTKMLPSGDGVHSYPDYFTGRVGLVVLAWGDPNPV